MHNDNGMGFILEVMRRFGFNEEWLELINECILNPNIYNLSIYTIYL